MKHVELIIANICYMNINEEDLFPRIAPCYVKKYQEHKIRKDKVQELVSGLLLKEYLGVVSDDQLKYNEYGKPKLIGDERYFNLSHSGDYVVLAIADCEVGIDVEETMPFHEATVKKVYREKQKKDFERVEGTARDEKFTEIWTKYEAVLKLNGTGFANGWDDIPIEKCHISTVQYEKCYISCATESEIDTFQKTVLLSI